MSQLIPEKSPGKWQHEMTNVFVIEYIFHHNQNTKRDSAYRNMFLKLPALLSNPQVEGAGSRSHASGKSSPGKLGDCWLAKVYSLTLPGELAKGERL
jgi:hypothetical protein